MDLNPGHADVTPSPSAGIEANKSDYASKLASEVTVKSLWFACVVAFRLRRAALNAIFVIQTEFSCTTEIRIWFEPVSGRGDQFSMDDEWVELSLRKETH